MLFFKCYHTYCNHSHKKRKNFLMTMISFSVSFFSQFLQISISSWRLYQLMVFIAKLWDENLILFMAFLLLKLKKFRYLSSLKSSFVCEKKVVLFIFISVKQGLNATVFSFFFGKTYAFFIFLLIYFTIQHLDMFKMRLDIPSESSNVSFLSPGLILC